MSQFKNKGLSHFCNIVLLVGWPSIVLTEIFRKNVQIFGYTYTSLNTQYHIIHSQTIICIVFAVGCNIRLFILIIASC